MILTVFLILVYCLSILGLIYGFRKAKEYTIPHYSIPKTKFTIIVPFRNEAENLPHLLESISKLDYPTNLFEVILVDDESLEKFSVSNFKFQVHLIANKRVSDSPKKDAIVTAIQMVSTDWVITTDADCIVPKKWLLTLDQYIQSNTAQMIAGAVSYECQNSFLHHFQQLDLSSLQGATIGSFRLGKGFMCNGANFAYSKAFFQELKGFQGNETIASGDDVFLLQKAIAYAPDKVHYLKSKDNIVTTKPLDNWKAVFHQRVRWAAKTKSYKSNFGKGLGLVVFTGNLALLLGFFFLRIEQIVSLFLIKILIDAVLIMQSNKFLNYKTRHLIASSTLYPFWSVSVALYSLLGKYEWKGRLFSK